VSCFNVLLSRICLEGQEDHRNPQSGWFASSSKFQGQNICTVIYSLYTSSKKCNCNVYKELIAALVGRCRIVTGSNYILKSENYH